MECRLVEFVLSGLEEGTEPHPELLSIVLTDLDSSYATRGELRRINTYVFYSACARHKDGANFLSS